MESASETRPAYESASTSKPTSCSDESPPKLSINLSLSSYIYHPEAPEVTVVLRVTTVLHPSTPKPITLDTRGHTFTTARSVLSKFLFLSHFTFTDTSNEIPLSPPIPDEICDSGLEIHKDDALTLHPGQPHTSTHRFSKRNVFGEPLDKTVPGHEYELSLIPHEVNWRWGTVGEIFRGGNWLEIEKFGAVGHMKLESEDVVRFRVGE